MPAAPSSLVLLAISDLLPDIFDRALCLLSVNREFHAFLAGSRAVLRCGGVTQRQLAGAAYLAALVRYYAQGDQTARPMLSGKEPPVAWLPYLHRSVF
jgi:hypothetical protein